MKKRLEINNILKKIAENNILKYLCFCLNNKKYNIKGYLSPSYYYYLKKEYPFLKYKYFESEPIISKEFERWSSTYELEYLIEYDNTVYIEPTKGFPFY